MQFQLVIWSASVSSYLMVWNEWVTHGDFVMLTGEEPLSYGYGGTGKASTDCQFKDFGESFTSGDVITAYLV